MPNAIQITAFLVGSVIVFVVFMLLKSPRVCPRKGCFGRRRSLTVEETRTWIEEQVAAHQGSPGASSAHIPTISASGRVPMKCRTCGEITYL